MTYRVKVLLSYPKGHELTSPSLSKDEAEKDLRTIADAVAEAGELFAAWLGRG